MSIPDESIFSLVLGQPLVLWSFLIGMLILVTAVTLFIISRLRQKKTAVAAVTLPPKTVVNEELAQLANDLLSNLDDEPINESSQSEAEVAAVPDPLAALAADAETSKNGQPPAFEVEVNSKLADLFQNDIIVDPRVQALRDSLDEIPMANLLEQVRSVSGQLKVHTSAMPKRTGES